jgi:hypothetical protein
MDIFGFLNSSHWKNVLLAVLAVDVDVLLDSYVVVRVIVGDADRVVCVVSVTRGPVG